MGSNNISGGGGGGGGAFVVADFQKMTFCFHDAFIFLRNLFSWPLSNFHDFFTRPLLNPNLGIFETMFVCSQKRHI